MKMSHQSVQRLAFSAAALLTIAALVASCAHMFKEPPSNVSSEGVRLTIRDYECTQITETTDPNQGADLSVDIEISNQSPAPLVVRTGAMQVVDAEGGSMSRRGWSQKAPVQVAAGSNQSLTMHFLGASKHCCSSRLALNPTGVTVGDRALSVAPINFVPACLF